MNGCLNELKNTVVRIVEIEDIEVGVVDDGSEPLEAHLIGFGVSGEPLGVYASLGDIEEGVDEGSLAGVAVAEDEDGSVVEFAVGLGLIKEVVPHESKILFESDRHFTDYIN